MKNTGAILFPGLQHHMENKRNYRQTSNIRRAKSQNLNVSRLVLAVVFVQSIDAMCQVEKEDEVGTAPKGGTPTRSEWSTISLPTKLRLISEVWGHQLSWMLSAVYPA